jgi:hypothetical protein
MVRLCITLGISAENFAASRDRTSNAILGHAFSSFFCDWFSFRVFLVQINFALKNFHYIVAATFDEVGIFSQKLRLYDFIDLLIVSAHVLT